MKKIHAPSPWPGPPPAAQEDWLRAAAKSQRVPIVRYDGPSSTDKRIGFAIGAAVVALAASVTLWFPHGVRPAPTIEVFAAPTSNPIEINTQSAVRTPVRETPPQRRGARTGHFQTDDDALRAVLASREQYDIYFGFDAATLARAERAAKRWREQGL